jgi:Zn-dependent peptidase ImmA (M78 family)
MKSPPALIKPELLVWARKSTGLSVEAAANKLKVKAERVEQWEAGTKRLSIAQLRKAAVLYRRPLAVFFLPEPPKDFQTPRDFRRVTGEAPPPSRNLGYELRFAAERREIALELAGSIGEETPRFDLQATLDEDPSTVAERLRSHLGVSLDEQLKATDQYHALRIWKHAVERLGVLVFETDRVAVEEARGFSVADATLPLIVLNGSDSTTGRVFTIGHELAHLVTRTAGVCEYIRNRADVTETFCNRVAAALLMPQQALLGEHEAARRSKVDFDAVEALAKRYWVSQEAMLIRLAELDRLPRTAVDDGLRTIRDRYAKPKKKQEGGLPQHYKVLKANGLAFTNLVLAAYRSEAITLVDVARTLEMQVKTLPKLQTAVFSKVG